MPSLPLTSLRLKKFKGVDNFNISKLGNVNIFFGRNNSGKSTILHALTILGSALNNPRKNVTHFHQSRRLMDLFPESDNFSLSFSFLGESPEENYVFSIENLNANIDNQNTVTFRVQKEDYSGNKLSYNETLLQNSIRPIYIEPSFNVGDTNNQVQTAESILDNFYATHHPNITGLNLLHALKIFSMFTEEKYGQFDYTSVVNSITTHFPELEHLQSEINPKNITITDYQEKGLPYRLDIIYSGTGLRTFLDLLIKTELSKANIVLIDEPERGLHPDQQRKLIEFIINYANDKNIQFFIATHSAVFLNYPNNITYYRAYREGEKRYVQRIESKAIKTVLHDLGLKPSDLFNTDICLLTEGITDVIFFEHIINKLYKEDFGRCTVTVQPINGSAIIDGINNEVIHIENVTSAKHYTYWIVDREAPEAEAPAQQRVKLAEKIGSEIHILSKREIEYYIPKKIYADFYGDKSTEVVNILEGDQKHKFRTAVGALGLPKISNTDLKKLLETHITQKSDIDIEIREIIENRLLVWKKEIIGS